MIAPDSLPVWFAIPVSIIATVVWLVLALRDACVEPDQGYSRLDEMDRRTG